MLYHCERKIRTLAENDVDIRNGQSSFEFDGVKYEQWEFNSREGWLGDAWLAICDTEAKNIDEAHQLFREKLLYATSRISLLAQCYIDFLGEPLLIHRQDLDIAYVQHVIDSEPVPLHFDENGLMALTELQRGNDQIKDEFFYYWNDVTNVTGYTAKLLLLFSAIEALCKDSSSHIDMQKRKNLLTEKYDTLFYQNNQRGLRHRLVHGEYMLASDTGEDYILIIHKAIVKYFNEEVFGRPLITIDVIGPQRNFNDNKDRRSSLVKPKVPGTPVTLKLLIDDFDHKNNRFNNYDDVYNYPLTSY